MASEKIETHSLNSVPDWVHEGLCMNACGAALRRRFGGRVQRVSLDAGFTCPNVDGSVARGGCKFCDNRSFSPSRRVRLQQVHQQLEQGIANIRYRYPNVQQFVAYFQPATNTYAPVDQLAELYELACTTRDDVVGLAIGTRPDCIPDAVLDLLETISQTRYVSLEFGMQTIHDASLAWMNRAHTHADLVNAMDRARGRGFECCAHIILGIPGESHDMMLATADEVVRLGFDAIKLHNLYAVRGTPLGDEVLSGNVSLISRADYIQIVVDFLERMQPRTIVERISGDAPPDYLIEPRWCLEKGTLRQAIEQEFDRRRTRQGSKYVAPRVDPMSRPRPADLTPTAILERIDTRGRLPVLKL